MDRETIEFQQRIRGRMHALDLTQTDLAELVGASQAQVSRWLNGGWPTARYLPPLADALQCSLDYLLRGHEPRRYAAVPVEDAVALTQLATDRPRPAGTPTRSPDSTGRVTGAR